MGCVQCWPSIVGLPRSLYQQCWLARWRCYRSTGHMMSSLWHRPRVFFCLCRRDEDLSPCPPTWDLYLVLVYLRVPVFESLASKNLCTVACKVLFLLSLATTKRVGELQVLSCSFAFRGKDLLFVLPTRIVAKTESERMPLPRIV